MSKHKIYTAYAELVDYKPKIWRRFEIDGQRKISDFVYYIMIMFEMQASHLFALTYKCRDYYIREFYGQYTQEEIENDELIANCIKNIHFEFPVDSVDEIYLKENEVFRLPNKHTLNNLSICPKQEFVLEYDYGDEWKVNIVIEAERKEEISLSLLPRVLEGEGYGIVEDIGGVRGLTNLGKILKRGKGKQYEEYTEWLDSTTLDLESFDINDINFRLKKLVRLYRDAYEYRLPPTEAALKLWNRSYLEKGNRGYEVHPISWTN